MALSLKEIQARLLEQEEKKKRAREGGGKFTGGDNAIYPFWDNPTGSTATMRFVPDKDETNDFFWRERLIIKLPFPGIKGSSDSKPVEVQVPCTDMWESGTCYVTGQIRPWWKDASLENMARKYYRKKSYLFQGFVTDNPNPDDTTPQNPIRRFVINPSIFDSIKTVLMDKDLEHTPTDYIHGLDYYLIKTSQGKYASYTSSKWARKERPLSDDEQSAISTFDLWDLKTFLPKKPDKDHLVAIEELFKASVDEELYDPDRWGQFYKPFGLKRNNESDEGSDESTQTSVNESVTQTPVSSTASSILSKLSSQTQPTENVTPQAQSSSGGGKPQTPEEIIAAIRARQQKK